MTRLVPIALALLLPALAGCHLEAGFVRGCGDLVTEERDPGAFDALENASWLGVDLSTGDEHRVTVTCDENLLPYVETFVEGSTLVIRLQPGVVAHSDRTCSADVVAPAWVTITASGSGYTFCDEVLDDLELVGNTGSGDVAIAGARAAALDVGNSGSGHVGISEVEADEVDLASSGSGSVALLGSVRSLELVNTGSGDVLVRDLVGPDVWLRNTGSGDVEVYSTSTLTGELTGSGDVHVWGDPEDVDLVSSGSGTIIYH